MKVITGKEAIELIEDAAAVIIMDEWMAVTYPSIEQLDDEFASVDVSYEVEGQEYEYSFKIWQDDQIEVKDNQLILREDNQQDVVGIKLLQIQQL